MKIGNLMNNVHYLNLNSKGAVAREDSRADRDGENGRDQYTRQQRREGEGEGERSPEEQQEQFEDALHAFQEDPLTQASGISAQTEGSGPGLRVVVKNATGGVIRNFSGEEFLKLRESLTSEGSGRGKLLDQKA